MRAVVQAQEEFILNNLVELICQLDDRSAGSYSQMIEFTLQESSAAIDASDCHRS